MSIVIRHIVEVMEEIAPSSLAESWDRIGLQVGKKGWPVRKIWVALDPTYRMLTEASENGVDLIICHHPLIFKPLSCIDPGTLVGKTIETALKHSIGIFCAHTNLDSAPGGVNDVFAERLGLMQTHVLKSAPLHQYRLVTFVPEDHERRLAEALFNAGAGKSEKYSHAAFRVKGTGSFKPLAGANPFLGETGHITYAKEDRLEVLVDRKRIRSVLEALHHTHPYEEVVYDLYHMELEHPDAGLGRIGELEHEISLKNLIALVKERLGADTAKVVGDPDQCIKKVALCGGSGKSLTEVFLQSDADVFITGDMGYHDGRTVEFDGRALIDIGHFYSEYPLVQSLVHRLSKAFDDRGLSVEVKPYTAETCCFKYY